MPNCKYCNYVVSPRARTCPRCGDNVGADREKESDAQASIVFGMIFLLVGLYFGGWFWWVLAALFLVVGLMRI